MLDGLKALLAVEKLGTVGEAAVALRLTQSAVTKRLQALEAEMGYRLFDKDGRRLRLTRQGQELILRARPLIADLENLKFTAPTTEISEFSIGLGDSIAASWGPAVLRRVMRKLKALKLEIHVHRGTWVIENIKLGRYDLGLVAGSEELSALVCSPLAFEEMVLIGSGDSILTIEPASATWREIGPQVTGHSRLQGLHFEFVESFAAAAQMAREGFGRALVPIGIAQSLGFKGSQYSSVSPRIRRQIQLVTRKTLYELEIIKSLVKHLKEALEVGNQS